MAKDSVRNQIINRYYSSFKPKAYDENNGDMPDLVKNDQHPEVLFISCVDSRAAPGVIFKTNSGEMFSQRHVAGLVPIYDPKWENGAAAPSIAAAIDFAVSAKKVSHVIVMGHTLCGGIKAYIEGGASPLVSSWMDHLKPILERLDQNLSKDELLRQAEKECVKFSYHNLMDYPAIQNALRLGSLTVEGWLNDIESGTLLRFEPENDQFIEIQEP